MIIIVPNLIPADVACALAAYQFSLPLNVEMSCLVPQSSRQPWSAVVEMIRSQTPAKPALSNRNIEICQWVIPGNDVLISSVESGLAEASRPR